MTGNEAILYTGIATAVFILLQQFAKFVLKVSVEDTHKEDYKVWQESDKIRKAFRNVKNERDAARVRERIHAFRNVQDGNTSRQGYAYQLEVMLNNMLLKAK